MANERIQGHIERLFDRVEAAADQRDWEKVRWYAEDVLALDPDNDDARAYIAAADRNLRLAIPPVEPTQARESVESMAAIFKQAEVAANQRDWVEVYDLAQLVLTRYPDNRDAQTYLSTAEGHLGIPSPLVGSIEEDQRPRVEREGVELFPRRQRNREEDQSQKVEREEVELFR